jgi:2-polyprenyl-6-methoxyphenol hydroxylase-like FAD-dependent oxidoreductase
MVDALIIGAGPTGLTLGCELIKRGLKVRLVEQLSQPTDQSRALGLQSRTLEVFERMDILDQFLEQGRIIHQGNFNHNHKLFGTIDFAAYLNAPYPFILVISQSKTEEILTAHFEKHGGKIERGITLQKMEDGQAILLHLNGKIEKPSARWIFGCDGAHSAVRHSSNLPFTGAAFPETVALADVEMQIDLPQDQAHFYFYENSLCGLFPLPEKNEFRIIAFAPQLTVDSATLDISFFHHHVSTCSGLPLKIERANWMSLFTIHRRITSKMRIGNTFLLGDAAHIHSPIGGQGLNTSVQDAFNLAWKIGLVHHGKGCESILDSFEKERLPVAQTVLRYTTLATKILTSTFLKRLLLPIVSIGLTLTFVKKYLARGLSELDVSYPNSPIIGRDLGNFWRGPKPGERAPDAFVAGNRRFFQLLCHPLHTLVCFGGHELEPFLDPIRRSFSQTIRIVPIPCDQAGEAAKVYHAAQPCFYLIRPDGIIAYRSKSLDPGPFLLFLSRIFIV